MRALSGGWSWEAIQFSLLFKDFRVHEVTACLDEASKAAVYLYESKKLAV